VGMCVLPLLLLPDSAVPPFDKQAQSKGVASQLSSPTLTLALTPKLCPHPTSTPTLTLTPTQATLLNVGCVLVCLALWSATYCGLTFPVEQALSFERAVGFSAACISVLWNIAPIAVIPLVTHAHAHTDTHTHSH